MSDWIEKAEQLICRSFLRSIKTFFRLIKYWIFARTREKQPCKVFFIATYWWRRHVRCWWKYFPLEETTAESSSRAENRRKKIICTLPDPQSVLLPVLWMSDNNRKFVRNGAGWGLCLKYVSCLGELLGSVSGQHPPRRCLAMVSAQQKSVSSAFTRTHVATQTELPRKYAAIQVLGRGVCQSLSPVTDGSSKNTCVRCD